MPSLLEAEIIYEKPERSTTGLDKLGKGGDGGLWSGRLVPFHGGRECITRSVRGRVVRRSAVVPSRPKRLLDAGLTPSAEGIDPHVRSRIHNILANLLYSSPW